MPAPFTLVTFRDADGDEFPVRVELVGGHMNGKGEILRIAGQRLRQEIRAGTIRPRPPYKPTRVSSEGFGSGEAS